MPVEVVPHPVEATPPRAGGVGCAVPTTCQPPSIWGKDPWPAIIRDITTTGLHLSLDRRFERGSGMAIELPGGDGTSSTVLARVVEVRALSEGGWLLDCTFVSELSSEEVEHVLRLDAVGRAGSDGVSAVRGVLFQARFQAGEMLRWYVKRLEVSRAWPLPQGEVVAMRVGGLSPETPPVELCVRRCKQFGSCWVVDCDFVSAPADSVLAVLTSPSIP